MTTTPNGNFPVQQVHPPGEQGQGGCAGNEQGFALIKVSASDCESSLFRSQQQQHSDLAGDSVATADSDRAKLASCSASARTHKPCGRSRSGTSKKHVNRRTILSPSLCYRVISTRASRQCD